ncbi:MAG TPA: CdaR family protein [Tissierellales bacterium]|nr:CdaR family protein [Tissierellales bacterium]
MSKEKENNITIKIFALVIAIIMWTYVASEVNPEITKEFRNIDVIFTNVDNLENAGIVALNPEEATVNVKLAGRRSDMVKISEDDITAKIDLEGYSEGTKKVPVDVEINSSRVRLVDYDPKVIPFEFDDISRKEEMVAIKTEGKLESGYVMGDIEVKSSSVFLKGPKTLMDSISEIVAIADIAGRTTDINLNLPIKILDENGKEIKGIDKNPTKVQVYIPVYKIKTVPVEIQTEGQLPDDYNISNMKAYPGNVKIKGKKEVIDKINYIQTASINVNDLIGNNGGYLELELPKGVELVDPNEKVKIIFDAKKREDSEEEIEEEPVTEKEQPVEKVQTLSFKYGLDDVEIKGLDPEFHLDRNESTNTITISAKGLESRVRGLSKKDFTPEINLQDLSEGTHNVKVNVKKLDGVELIITPTSMKVVLTKD